MVIGVTGAPGVSDLSSTFHTVCKQAINRSLALRRISSELPVIRTFVKKME